MKEFIPQEILAALNDESIDSGVDVTLIVRNLKMTPTERWQQNHRAAQFVKELREAGRVRRGRKDLLHLLDLREMKKLHDEARKDESI
jgi:hypothetical protein